MKRDIININFNTLLNKKIPNRTKLANVLAEVLPIEKEAIYRRLRGEVAFTFAEVAIIAEKLGISLDHMIGIVFEDKASPMILQMSDYLQPGEIEYSMWQNFIDVLRLFGNESNFQIAEVWSTLPFPFTYQFSLIARFYLFKWAFQCTPPGTIKRFDHFIINPQLLQFSNLFLAGFKKAATTEIILSESIYRKIIKDIRTFHSIGLLTDANKLELYHALLTSAESLEELTIQGRYPDTEGNLMIYIAQLDIDTNFTLIESSNNYVSLLRTLIFNAATTSDERTYQYMKTWFTGMKRLSYNISVTGERERIQFFRDQYEIIESLLD